MNTGPSRTVPDSNLVLIASLTYTLVAYAIIRGLWGIVIAPQLFFIVVGVQLAMLLLGGSRVLTGLGAAFLAALLAVASLFAAVFLIFPPSLLYKAGALASGGSTILFILFSFVTAYRGHSSILEEQVGTVDSGVLFMDDPSTFRPDPLRPGSGQAGQGDKGAGSEGEGPSTELRTDSREGGEQGASAVASASIETTTEEEASSFAEATEDKMADKENKPVEHEDLFADEEPVQEGAIQEESVEGKPVELADEPVTEYEFDDLSDEKLEISLAGGSENLFPDETGPSEPLPEEPLSAGFAPDEGLPVNSHTDTANANFDIRSLELTDIEESKHSPEPSLEVPPEAPVALEESEPLFSAEEGEIAQDDLVNPEEWMGEMAREISETETGTETETETGNQTQTQAQTQTQTVTEPDTVTGQEPEESQTDLGVRSDDIMQPEESTEAVDPPAPLQDIPVIDLGLAPDTIDPGAVDEPSPAVYPKEFKMRTHYRVLDSGSGELYGIYYGDEGYASLDLVTLSALLGEKIGSPEINIVKLDWSNFDEIEVHVEKAAGGGQQTEELAPEATSMASEQSYPWEEAPQAAEAGTTTANLSDGIKAPRYMIYDRRTIQPMMEYIPEGDRPRIDRLTLYKLFPEYDFKTFEIDSIRWHEDEVRIFIRGEKKKSPKSKIQNPKI
jgi:hypothetical protein